MPVRPFCLALVLSVATIGCSSSEDAITPRVGGLTVLESDAPVATSFDRLVDSLEAVPPVGIVAQIDHAANAASAGLTLRPTRVVLFGNPALGTPLMQINPQAGLDLPQKMLVYQDASGQTQVAYNTVDYLAGRHGVEAAATLDAISGALSRFARAAAGTPVATTRALGAGARDEGVVSVASANDLETTYGRLRDAIEANANLRVVAELDHQANAARVGLDLRPTRLLVFGNPALGTPLMQAGQTVAIDLPQKMLVYQDADGAVTVAYNDPAYLAERHRLGDVAQVETIRGALEGLASTATSRE